MSIVVTPPSLNHQPFSESDIYSASSSSSSSSPSSAIGSSSTHDRPTSPSPIVEPARTLVPFPVFQHRHTSPFPMTTHSFSALGPGPVGVASISPSPSVSPPRPTEVLGSIPLPPAPKPGTLGLPGLTPGGTSPGTPAEPDSGQISPSEILIETRPPTLPPTPDPSPPNTKIIFPDAMIKLAPPADEQYDYTLRTELLRRSEETPRRAPALAVENLLEPTSSTMSTRRAAAAAAIKERPKSMGLMGPPARPMRRSQTAIHPSSVRMGESKSADQRAVDTRARARAMGKQPYVSGRTASPGLPRSLTSPVPDHTTPIRSTSDTGAPDMGGPDGLEAKVVLLGSQGVGKTSLILRYTTRIFSPHPAAATIGSSLHTRKLVHDGVRVKLQIWDTAGQERFRSMAPIYYRGAHVCVLVYDVSDRGSFEDVRSWLEELGKTVPKETVIYIVGSKVDLAAKRVIRPQEAYDAIRDWLNPPSPPPPSPPPMLSPPSRSLFRSSSLASRDTPTHTATASILSSPTPTRSHSHTALTALSPPAPSVPPPRNMSEVEPDARASSNAPSRTHSQRKAFPPSPHVGPTRPSAMKRSDASKEPRPAAIKITTIKPDHDDLSVSPRSRKISFPALQSPTLPTSVTFTEPVKPSMMPASPSRHGSSTRFSISGISEVLGYGGGSRSPSFGAASSLARLAEDYPTSPKLGNSGSTGSTSAARAHSFGSYGEGAPPRARTESSPMLDRMDQRRKSEDWSSRSWRMGEGPGAEQALGEFGAGVKRKQSGELLGSGASGSGIGSGGHASGSATPALTSAAAAGGLGLAGANTPSGFGGNVKGRARGGSLGRDSRLYGSADGSGSEAGEDAWGVEVEGVRVGEVSAATGEGVEALFKSISALLVQKREKIERERTLRRKDSVMLDDADGKKDVKGKSRGCCA